MTDYILMKKILSIIVILSFLMFLTKILISSVRAKRIGDFSLNKNNDKMSFEYSFYSFLHKFSKLLKNMVLFNGVAKTYDKYINEDDKKLNDGMDYISLKIIIGVLFSVLCVLGTYLYSRELSTLVLILTFIIGFIVPDFYCFFKSKKENIMVESFLLRVVIIMNNSFKANRSTEQAINDVIVRTNGIVKREFCKILYDIKIGLSVADAFMRMYDRTKIKLVKEIAQSLLLVNKVGVSSVLVFENLEKKIIEEEKVRNEKSILKRINYFFLIICLIIPVFVTILFISTMNDYYKILLNSYGLMLVVILLLIYLIYAFIAYKLVGDKNE